VQYHDGVSFETLDVCQRIAQDQGLASVLRICGLTMLMTISSWFGGFAARHILQVGHPPVDHGASARSPL
jgi:hypothetical protein